MSARVSTPMAPRITFVHSPEVYYEQSFGTRFAPVWAYALAAYVEAPWHISIHDLTLESVGDIDQATVFAFSGINQDIGALRRAHGELKRRFPDAIFIVGGPIAWSYEKNGNLSDLDFFDHVFILDGEETLPEFLRAVVQGRPSPKIIRAPRRFPMELQKPLRFDLLQRRASSYYGGVLEVARGCPFLCEFCDIRVLPQNNETHGKRIELILQELAEYHRLGIRQIQLACDNFIGDTAWAQACVSAIEEWTNRTGAQMAIHTWVTVNLAGQRELMVRMRQAGFTSLFIGVESFNANSVLETSKVQNKNDSRQLVDALRLIHSFGFVIAPGLIFGFDSDTADMFDDTLDGVRDAGLIGGDPTFLLALPGTPLYHRMKVAGRLVGIGKDSTPEKAGLAIAKARISKIESNIKYLQPLSFLIYGFIYFQRRFTSASYSYARFRSHVGIIVGSGNLVYRHRLGYGNLARFLKFQLSSPRNARMFLKRGILLSLPWNLLALIRAYALVLRHRSEYPGLPNHFMFWAFAWSNLLLKYSRLAPGDFQLKSVEKDFDLRRVWDATNTPVEPLTAGRNADGVKVSQQMKATQGAIRNLRAAVERDPNWVEAYLERAEHFRKVA